jgi:hypothetical protein
MFYQIKPLIDKKVTGIDGDQSTTGIYPNDVYHHPLYILQWNFNKVPENIITPIPKLKSKAKLTDLLSVYNIGTGTRLNISTKLKDILVKYHHGNLEFIPIKIIKGVREINGYWMSNALTSDNDKLDFAKSEFEISNSGISKIKDIAISSLKEYTEIKSQLIYPEVLFISKPIISNDIKNHILIIKDVNGAIGYFISDFLKQEIENSSCSGIDFKLIN